MADGEWVSAAAGGAVGCSNVACLCLVIEDRAC